MILNTIYKTGGSAFTINASANEWGSISPSGACLYAKGTTATFTLSPTSFAYESKSVEFDGLADPSFVQGSTSYSVTNITKDHTVKAIFGIKQYTVTCSVTGAGGTISSNKSVVDYYGNAVLTMVPATGYQVKSLKINNVDVTSGVTADNKYNLNGVMENKNCVVEFELQKFRITATQTTGGTISPSYDDVDYMGTSTFTITPDSANGYETTDVKVDGASKGVQTSWMFTDVVATHTITATYALKTYAVNCSVDGGTGGSISASPASVTHGNSCTITCTPDTQYKIKKLTVNGADVTSGMTGNQYIIPSVTAVTPVVVYYELKTYEITVTQGANGTITPGTKQVVHGTNQKFTITAGTGYVIDDVLVDGSSVGALTEYTFTNVTAPHTITAVFLGATFTITASAGTGGSITSPGVTTIAYHGNKSYTITPDSSHEIDDVVVDSVSKGAVTSWDFNLVEADHTISATFKDRQYTVTCSVVGGTGGSISASVSPVTHGGSSKITCTPTAGWSVKEFKINGAVFTSSLVNNEYTITNITTDQVVSVEYTEAYTGDFYIDKALLSTNPSACVVYGSGGSAAAAKTQVWNWLHPSVVKDGAVAYFLDKNDLTKKVDGTASNLTGADGDVMVSIDPIYWKVITNDSTKLEFKISDKPFDGCVTAHKFNGTNRKYLHVGMFHMSNSSACSVYNTTCSSGSSPWVNKTNDQFRTAAEARGSTYCTMTYRTWTLLEILTVFASGGTDCQSLCGQDYTGASNYTAVATSAMLTANGWTQSTKTSATTPLMWMFFAELWGNVFDFISGIKSHSGTMHIADDQAKARGVSVTTVPTDWVTYSLSSTTLSGYQSEARGESDYPFAGKAVSGSSSTYYCDNWYSHRSGNFCAYVGGYYDYGGNAGVFRVAVSDSSSTARTYSGARLQCLDVNNA